MPPPGADSPATTTSSGIPVEPHNREAEEALLGAVLINPEVFFEVASFLGPSDFYIHRNGWIWDTFQHLVDRQQPIDALTVAEELERRGRLAEAGGAAYIAALMDNVPTSLHAEAYGRMVEEQSVRRRLLAAAGEIAAHAHNAGTSVTDVVGEAEKAVFEVSQRRLARDVQPIDRVISEYFDRLEYLTRHPEESLGIPTGFGKLDELLGGMQRSDLLIIAGRPGLGKSAMLLSIAKNVAQTHKKHVAMFSMEMSNEQLIQRLISQETRIDSHKFRQGKVSEEEWARFTHAASTLSEVRIFLDDTPALTPLQLRSKCRRLHLEYNLDLVLVDYLQLMGSDFRSENRVQEVSYISRYLKALARELNVPVVAAAQLSRAVEQRTNKRPQLSDLRESGSLEQDADIVMFIHRQDEPSSGEAGPGAAAYGQRASRPQMEAVVTEIIVSKHRHGPTGSVELIFFPSRTRFENAATASQIQTAPPQARPE
ncbi:MAG: replicative DNA helicase [Anaerolineales bacterium]